MMKIKNKYNCHKNFKFKTLCVFFTLIDKNDINIFSDIGLRKYRYELLILNVKAIVHHNELCMALCYLSFNVFKIFLSYTMSAFTLLIVFAIIF